MLCISEITAKKNNLLSVRTLRLFNILEKKNCNKAIDMKYNLCIAAIHFVLQHIAINIAHAHPDIVGPN